MNEETIKKLAMEIANKIDNIENGMVGWSRITEHKDGSIYLEIDGAIDVTELIKYLIDNEYMKSEEENS